MNLQLAYHLSNLLRLPWVGWIILATVISSLFQSLGLSLFIPLLKLLVSDDSELFFPFSKFPEIFEYFGISYDIPHILFFIVVLNILGLTLIFAQRSLILAFALPRYTRDTSHELVNALFMSSWHHISLQATGEVTNQLIHEASNAARALTHLASGVATVLQAAIILGFAVLISPNLLLLALGFGILLIIVVRPLQRRTYRLAQELTEANGRFGYHIVDFLSNLKLVKATASEQRISGRLDDLRKDACDALTRRQIILNATHLIVQAMSVILIAITIGFGTLAIKIDPALMLVFFIFLARVAPLATQCQQSFQSYFMDLPALEVIDRAILDNNAEKEVGSLPAVPIIDFQDSIHIQDVHYCYPGAKDSTLNGVSLTIQSGQLIALVGQSGGGKSTLIDLLCGLRMPTTGKILVDGKSLGEMNIHAWRRRIGYVAQDVAILNDTLSNNVRFTNPGASDQDVAEALRLVNLDETVAAMDHKLETVLGENGVRLSGGQKQRLALARALLGGPQLLLLDEATSALDNESERAVQEAIESIAHRFTIVVIAHRLSTVRNADVICVIEDGRIVEQGSYDQLRQKQGRFSRLLDLQFS